MNLPAANACSKIAAAKSVAAARKRPAAARKASKPSGSSSSGSRSGTRTSGTSWTQLYNKVKKALADKTAEVVTTKKELVKTKTELVRKETIMAIYMHLWAEAEAGKAKATNRRARKTPKSEAR